MRLTYAEVLAMWNRGVVRKPIRTGPGRYDYKLETSRHTILGGEGVASESRQEPSGCAKDSNMYPAAPSPPKDTRYRHLDGPARREAIRESNQRAGGDPYGG